MNRGSAPLRRRGRNIRRAWKRVIAGDDGGVENLLERMPAGLAGLQLDQVENLVLAVQQEIVEAQEYAGAIGEGSRRPGGLRAAGNATARSTSASVPAGILASTPPVKGAGRDRAWARGQGHLRKQLAGQRRPDTLRQPNHRFCHPSDSIPPENGPVTSFPSALTASQIRPNLQTEFPVRNSTENENMDAKSPDAHQRLSGADAAFLYLERKEIPLHIACVCTFEEAIPFEEFVATIDSKLHLLPRYRQLAVIAAIRHRLSELGVRRHFDIRRHILRVTVNAPGGEAELEELAGRIFSLVMDRDKPLWEVYVVEGLSGGRGALIAEVHHALADGIAGASLLRVMLDPTPKVRTPSASRTSNLPAAAPREPSLTDAIASAIHSSLENLVAAEAGLLGFAQGLLSDAHPAGAPGPGDLLPEIADARVKGSRSTSPVAGSANSAGRSSILPTSRQSAMPLAARSTTSS